MASDPTSHCLVDPYLLQRPGTGQWGDALESILAWLEATTRPIRFVLSSACAGFLMEEGNCPYLNPHALDATLRSEGESSISAVDLQTGITRLLSKAHYLDGEMLVEDLIVEPRIVATRQASEDLATAFPEALVAFHLTEGRTEEKADPSVASRAGNGLDSETEIAIRSRLLYVEGFGLETSDQPADLSFNLHLLFRPLARTVDLGKLATDPKATIVKAYELQVPASDRGLYPLRDFAVSEDFACSILEHHLESRCDILAIIVRQTVRVLSGQQARFPSMEIHPHRRGPGPSDPPLTRADGAVAYRVRLTTYGAGYRLLYWQKGSFYELWEVRTESE